MAKQMQEEFPRKELKAQSRQDVYLTEDGREKPSAQKIAPPLGYTKRESLVETIRRMVRSEALRNEAEAAGMETLEEADDFDVGDDYDPSSPYEYNFDPPVVEIPQAPATWDGRGGGPEGDPVKPLQVQVVKEKAVGPLDHQEGGTPQGESPRASSPPPRARK